MPYIPIITYEDNTIDNYEIELCKTLETKQEIRACLEVSKKDMEYVNVGAALALISIIVICALVMVLLIEGGKNE